MHQAPRGSVRGQLSHFVVSTFATVWTVALVVQVGILEWIALSSSRLSSHTGTEPLSPVLQDSSPAEPSGKPMRESNLPQSNGRALYPEHLIFCMLLFILSQQFWERKR